MAQPPNKPPLHVVRAGNPEPRSGIDWKTLGLTVGFTTLVSVMVTMMVYGVKDRMGRKKNPNPAPPELAPFVSGSPQVMLQGGHFIYVPAGAVAPRDTNPGLPNALRYTPGMSAKPVPPDPNAVPSWFLSQANETNSRLDRIESFLSAQPTDAPVA